MANSDLDRQSSDAASALMESYGETAITNGRVHELLQLAWLQGHRASDSDTVTRLDEIIARLEAWQSPH